MSSPLENERCAVSKFNKSFQNKNLKGQALSLSYDPQPSASKTFISDPSTFNFAPSTLSTGIKELDQLLKGGVPRGKITEMIGPASSGKTSVGLSILSQSICRGEIAAYVDSEDSFDPKCAQALGIDLENLLWIRCAKGGNHQLDPLRKALKAADILCQAGGFGVIAIDLAAKRENPRIPLNNWFRLQRAIRETPTVLIVISSQKTTGSAASLVLSFERNRSFWTSGKRSQFIQKPYFQGIESEAWLLKGRSYGSVTVHCRF